MRQAREKFAVLQISTSRGPDTPEGRAETQAIYAGLAEFAAASGETCQVCGEHGILRRDLPPGGSWWAALCDRHAAVVASGEEALGALYRMRDPGNRTG